MKKQKNFLLKLVITISFLLVSFSFSAFKPGRTTCIAPAGPGGGWDFTCRTPAATVMKDLKLVPGTMKVVNMAGGGGAVAYAHVVNKRKGDNNLITAASQATAVRLAQNAYPGFTEKDVNWLGAIGADYGVIAVSKNSPYKSLGDLVNAMKSNPQNVRISGGSAAGGWDHLKVLLVAKEGKVKDLSKVNYVSFNSGGTALIELIGNRVDAFTGDTSEVLGQLDAGEIQILAVLSPERIKRLGNAKTAKEQGYDVIGANWRGFYAPKGISKDALNYWSSSVEKVANSKEWEGLMEQNGLAPFKSFGKDFEKFLKAQIKDIKSISKTLGLIKK